jgi:hypothetical protein
MKGKYCFNARKSIRSSLTLLIVLFLMPLFISACSFSGKRTEKDFRYGDLSKERGVPRKNSLLGDILTFIVNHKGKLSDIEQVIDKHIKVGQFKNSVLQLLKDNEFTVKNIDNHSLAILKIEYKTKPIISISAPYYRCIIILEFDNNRVKKISTELEHPSL